MDDDHFEHNKRHCNSMMILFFFCSIRGYCFCKNHYQCQLDSFEFFVLLLLLRQTKNYRTRRMYNQYLVQDVYSELHIVRCDRGGDWWRIQTGFCMGVHIQLLLFFFAAIVLRSFVWRKGYTFFCLFAFVCSYCNAVVFFPTFLSSFHCIHMFVEIIHRFRFVACMRTKPTKAVDGSRVSQILANVGNRRTRREYGSKIVDDDEDTWFRFLPALIVGATAHVAVLAYLPSVYVAFSIFMVADSDCTSSVSLSPCIRIIHFLPLVSILAWRDAIGCTHCPLVKCYRGHDSYLIATKYHVLIKGLEPTVTQNANKKK